MSPRKGAHPPRLAQALVSPVSCHREQFDDKMPPEDAGVIAERLLKIVNSLCHKGQALAIASQQVPDPMRNCAGCHAAERPL